MAHTRDSILAAKKKPKVKKVDHPAVVEYFGEAVFVRVMTGRDRDSWEQGNIRWINGKAEPDMSNRKARLIVRCLCEEESGARLLKDTDAGTAGEWDGNVLDLLEDECTALNGLTKEAQEELRKNSPNGQSAVSGFASPAISE